MAKVKKSGKKSTNPWIKHLQEYAREHPEKSYVDCMKEAKKTYKK